MFQVYWTEDIMAETSTTAARAIRSCPTNKSAEYAAESPKHWVATA